jgi:hypothetical protein
MPGNGPYPAVPVEQLRAMIRLLWPEEITPTAKRQFELLCEQHDIDANTRGTS